jgi:hypothetical protein
VCIDEDRDKFDRAVKNAGVTWSQVFDGNGTNGALVKLFNARAVPISYLISSGDKIAANIVIGTQLQQQMTNLMEKR